MADIITNFFLTPVANRIAATQTKKLAPSLIELGADSLTRNPQREAIARLFSPASSNGLIARLDSFLTAQTAQNAAKPAANTLKNSLKSTTGLRTANDTGAQTQQIFTRRETGAELRLKELLKPPAAATTTPAQNPAEKTPAPPAVPAITRNAGLRVNEGGSAVLDSSRLRAGDADTRPQDIVFTVDDSGPRHGQLELVSKPGEAVTTFTQRDLDIGRIRYVSDGSEFTTDSFNFTVSDGTSAQKGSFAISISPVNDTPAAAVNAGLTVDEGGSAALTTAQLSAADPDGLADTTVFEITSGPVNGRLEIGGNAVTSFTQADLQAGRVTYVNDGSENTSDSFSFRINDGSATSAVSNFNINVRPVDDAPVASVNTGLTLDEGGSAAITSAQLSTSDVDTAPENISYTVTSGPANGRLEFTDNAGIAITSFTQADVDAGRLRYVNDGSENTSDSFTFTVADSTTGLPAATFNINISPVDDAPVQSINLGATLNEGGSVALSSSQLQLSDVDTAPQDLRYTVTRGPDSGRLEFSDNSGIAITSFTQSDINAGRVRYVNNGAETTSDSFTFTASDATTGLPSASFNFTINPVDDAPVLANNTGAALNEGATATITAAQLRLTDVDTTAQNLSYSVTSGTVNGRLELSTNPGIAVTTFTQADIDAGRLRYVNNGSENTTDSFSFTARDGTTTLGTATFNFTVAPVNDAPTLVNNGGTVTEGGSSIIGISNLRATDPDSTSSSLVYTVTTAPTNGRLENTQNAGVAITSFTQDDLAAGRVRFVHDGSETVSASFGFSLSDGQATLANNTFNFNVTPVNDAPIQLTNTGTAVTRRTSTIITSSQLRATDADSANITYTISRAPGRGRLELTTNPGVSVTSFTQADIDAGRVRYVHTSLRTTDDSFRFRVSDGNTTLAVQTFTIDVQ